MSSGLFSISTFSGVNPVGRTSFVESQTSNFFSCIAEFLRSTHRLTSTVQRSLNGPVYFKVKLTTDYNESVLTVLTAVSHKTLFPVDHMYGLQSSHVPELIRMSDGSVLNLTNQRA